MEDEPSCWFSGGFLATFEFVRALSDAGGMAQSMTSDNDE